MEKGISVIICCYNSSSRIEKTLEHLINQKNDNIRFEVVLVDNNCSDNTVEVAKSAWSKFGSEFPLNIVKQTLPGLSMARKKGIESSKFDIVLFCDDDNWLCNDYLLCLENYLRNNKLVGIVGGHPEFHTIGELPSWFSQYKVYYATGAQASCSGNILPDRGYLFGAGMAVRKHILNKIEELGVISILSDRSGDVVSSGGDIEFCTWVRKLGYEIHYLDELKLTHAIDYKRISWEYIIRLFKGFAESNVILDLYSYHFFNSTGMVLQGTQLHNNPKHHKFGYRILFAILFLKSLEDFGRKYSINFTKKDVGSRKYLDYLYHLVQMRYYLKSFFLFGSLNKKIFNYSKVLQAHEVK